MIKNLTIVILVIIIVVLTSFLYKQHIIRIYSNFPILIKDIPETGMKTFYIYFYFHSHDYPSCLEVIQILNNLPRHFVVTGIVSENEFKDKDTLRRVTGSIFPLDSITKYKNFIPPISPAMIGVSEEGGILFILPAIPNQNEYLLDFLQTFYYERILVGVY